MSAGVGRVRCCCRACLRRSVQAALRRLEADQPDLARAILELLDGDIKAIAHGPDRICLATLKRVLAAALPNVTRSRAAEVQP